MAVERATEKVSVVLQNGQSQEILLYRYLTAKQKLSIENKLFAGLTVKNESDLDVSKLDVAKLGTIWYDIAECVWADKNFTLDDCEPESLSGAIVDRFQSFLGGLGLSRKVQGSNSG